MIGVFVNTSDTFQDCWGPFFALFQRFGGSLNELPIYLNTERKDFDWPGAQIVATKVWAVENPIRPTWSACLRKGLQVVKEPYVLYLQEDYFLTKPVDDELLRRALQVMRSDPLVGVVYLNEFGPLYTDASAYDSEFMQIKPPSRYLMSTQAAIWRKEVLLSLICEWENGWMFEICGSVRASTAPHKFLIVNPRAIAFERTVRYVYTGVMKGQWKAECETLFNQHGIDVDFSRRGFYRDKGRFKSRLEVMRKLTNSPAGLLKSVVSILQAKTRQQLIGLEDESL